jgi:hypothetical protein
MTRIRDARTAVMRALLYAGLVLIPGVSWAGPGGNGFPTLQLQGPSSIKASQSFALSFGYPPTLAHSTTPYVYWDMEIYHCDPGADQAPGDVPGDTGLGTFPGLNGAMCNMVGPSPQAPFYRKALTGPGSGNIAIGMMPYLTGIHQTLTHQSSAASLQKWMRGSTIYVRVRLSSPSAGEGPWSYWHRTAVGSGITLQAGQPGANLHGPAQFNYGLVMRGMKSPVIISPRAGSVQRGNTIPLTYQLPVHPDYGKWLCCDMQFQRAVITTAANLEVSNRLHHFPVATQPRKPWPYPNGYASTSEKGMISPGSQWSQTPSAGPFQPHSAEFGYRYWMRVREEYLPGGFGHSSQEVPGPWSAWQSFYVQDPLMMHIPSSAFSPSGQGQSQGAQQNGQSGQQHGSQLPAVQSRRPMGNAVHLKVLPTMRPMQ